MHTSYEILMMLEHEREMILENLESNNSQGMSLCLQTDLEEMAELVSERMDLLVQLELINSLISRTKFIISEG